MAQYVDGFVIPVPKRKVKTYLHMARLKAGETVVFSWIVYRSRAHRDKVNKDAMPWDMKRFAMGGFEVMVAW